MNSDYSQDHEVQDWNVLIVDDDGDQVQLLKHLLYPYDFHLWTAENGYDAQDTLRTTPIDLILTDFRMPMVNGVELLRWCRKHSMHMPVIFMSADDRLFTEEEIALGDCCATVIKKPINRAVFHEAVRAAIRRQHNLHCVHQDGSTSARTVEPSRSADYQGKSLG